MARVLAHAFDAGHPVLVLEENGLRRLEFGSGIAQSSMDIHHPELLSLAYTRAMMLALALTPALQRVLALGLGGGSIPRFLLHHFPAVSVDVVELSTQVVALARRYFCLDPGPRLFIHEEDASVFVRRFAPPGPYDAVFVDLFEPEAMAAPIFDPSFHEACLGLLAPRGVLCVNLWSGDSRRHRLALDALSAGCLQAPLLLPVARRSNVIAFVPAAPQSHGQVLARARGSCRMLEERLSLPMTRYLAELAAPSPSGGLLRRLFRHVVGSDSA